ncbi:FecR domain-containing protein [Thauera linaloolentis]|uniref:Fe2+-dicitrate sensor, membrane protein n=1 Tax=Thauera linaloolentis (strain DSM 12138 / JCM 21573 / CCUG 41526 / CIP 105981 / IAM 15112 / NBRC 102519 / 47Lol) TaxID=1123367 RepID=N6YX02_THAL4|nr:FecR domain-containing protein [Thauera linaloolentis]ENO86922.1 Fe2+-dicitrate sensor, membrane protein [Thauera linaloolentis 47Lol = DSM 12138]MCM8566665.1 FecR domain-containing protein [Thauera linaloolentis]
MPPEAGNGRPPGATALQQAAEWFAVLHDNTAGEDERRRWQAWLAASAENRLAWARVETVTRSFASLGTHTQADTAHDILSCPPSRARRRVLKLLAGGGVATLGGWLGHTLLTAHGWRTQLAVWRADERTAIGEVRELTLADGSQLWLNTRSAADLDYGPRLRRILLHAGELLLDTAPDPAQPPRPLVVDTQHGRLTALGTRFSVSLEDEATLVAVFDGMVEIAPRDAPAQIIPAGRQIRFSRHSAAPATPARSARESWTRGLLVADDRRLDDFVAELSRYVSVRIEVAPDIAALRLVGVYPIRDPARDVGRALTAVQQALPVRARQLDSHDWRIEAR